MREIRTSGSEEGSAGVIQPFYSPGLSRGTTDLFIGAPPIYATTALKINYFFNSSFLVEVSGM